MNTFFRRMVALAAIALLFASSHGCKSKTDQPEAQEAPSANDDAASAESPPETAPETPEPPPAPDKTDDTPAPEIDLNRLSETMRAQIQRAQRRVKEAPGNAARIGELGMQYLALGFHDAAIRCFDQAIERLPSAMQYHYLRALAHQSAAQLDEAERGFRETIEIAPEYVPAYVNLAKVLRLNDDDAACGYFEKAMELDPNDVIGLWGLATCREEQGDTDAAIQLLNRALEVQADNADVHFALARLYRKKELTTEADAHLKAYENGQKPVITNDPLRFEVVRRTRNEADIARSAIELAKAGKTDKAARFLESALANDIDSKEIRSALGGIYLSQHHYQLAVTQFKAGLSMAPDSTELRSNMARALAESGNLDEAEEILRDIIAKAPKDAVSLNRLAMLQAKRGDAAEAEKLLRRALEADPDAPTYRLNLADLLINAGKADEGKALLDPIDASSPAFGQKCFLLGLIAVRSGDSYASEEQLMRAIQADPTLDRAYAALAELLLSRNQTNDALKCLLAGIQKAPYAADLKNNAAWILATCPDEAIRNGSLAVTLAEAAVEIDGNRHDNFVGTLAAAYAEAGRYEEAERTARRAAQLARDAGQTQKADRHEMRAGRYAEGKPYRTPSP